MGICTLSKMDLNDFEDQDVGEREPFVIGNNEEKSAQVFVADAAAASYSVTSPWCTAIASTCSSPAKPSTICSTRVGVGGGDVGWPMDKPRPGQRPPAEEREARLLSAPGRPDISSDTDVGRFVGAHPPGAARHFGQDPPVGGSNSNSPGVSDGCFGIRGRLRPHHPKTRRKSDRSLSS